MKSIFISCSHDIRIEESWRTGYGEESLLSFSFCCFLDPNVSPYSQISPPGLPGFRSKCLSVCWIKLKPRNCFEYEKAALTLERDGSQDKTELRTSSTLNSVNIQRKFHNFFSFSCSDIGGNILDILNIHSNKRSTGRKYWLNVSNEAKKINEGRSHSRDGNIVGENIFLRLD